MDLKELDYIVTVANEGSISRAAEKLFMAQSSLSQAVRLFEQDLGTPIFVRTARGVRPTSAGEAFIFHARQILQQYQEARSEASDIENLKGVDDSKTVEAYLESVNASVVEFARFEVGEGIEKAANDFEAEVAATMAAALNN